MQDLIEEYQNTAELLEQKIRSNRQKLTQVRGAQYLELLKRTTGLQDMLLDVDYALAGMTRSVGFKRGRKRDSLGISPQ